MKSLQEYIQQASINAKKRNVRFIQDFMLNGKNAGKIGSFVIFTAENPNTQTLTRKENDKLRKELAKELKRCHYIHVPVKGFFDGNEEQSTVVFNMRLEVAKAFNYKYQQTSFFYLYPNKSNDGFIAEYWEKTDTKKPVDKVRNPYIKKGETDVQHEGADSEGNYTLIANKYKFHFDSSMFTEAIDTIERGLDIVCEKFNIKDRNWLIDHLTNSIGQKVAVMRSCFYKQ